MLNLWLIAVLLIAIVFGIFYLDHKLLVFIEELRKQCHIAVHNFFRIISLTPLVVLALYVVPAIFVFLFLGFFSVIALTMACVFATGLAFVGKYVFKRVRPLGHLTYLGKIDSAFPSAHSAGSFASAFMLALFWPAWGMLFFTLASLIALSRIYLELHFFSDIMGGVLVAYLIAIFILDSQVLLFLGF